VNVLSQGRSRRRRTIPGPVGAVLFLAGFFIILAVLWAAVIFGAYELWEQLT